MNKPDYPDPDLVDLLVPNPTPELMCKIMNDPAGPVQLFTKGRVKCLYGHSEIVTVRCWVPLAYKNPYGIGGGNTASRYYDRYVKATSLKELTAECWDLYQNFWKDQP